MLASTWDVPLERIIVPDKVFTGLGSRGMLYHAFLSQKIAEAILALDDTKLALECRRQASCTYTSLTNTSRWAANSTNARAKHVDDHLQ
ncbi:hypothetical protein AAMO2058_001483700 [Amorphochlora amoebiformis]